MSNSIIRFYGSDNIQTNKGPRTLILDLDETLVHSWESPIFIDTFHIYTDPLIYRRFHPKATHSLCYSLFLSNNNGFNRIWGLKRPYLYEFLNFCNEYFDNIIVWSAGIKPYVDEITKEIFLESSLNYPKLIWPRNKCSTYQGLFHKPISEINAELITRPYSTFKIDPQSTLILDDKQHTFMMNPANGVLIEPYYPGKNRPDKNPLIEDLLDRSDNRLLQFMEWLKRPEVRNAEDVRSLDKTHIFY